MNLDHLETLKCGSCDTILISEVVKVPRIKLDKYFTRIKGFKIDHKNQQKLENVQEISDTQRDRKIKFGMGNSLLTTKQTSKN